MTSQTSTKAFQEKSMKVAAHVMAMSEDIGRDYHTANKELALMMAHSLAILTTAETPEEVERKVTNLIEARDTAAPDIEVWTYLCLFVNWLSWGWHEQGETELAEAWAKQWYRINDYSLDHLEGEDLKYYIRTTD